MLFFLLKQTENDRPLQMRAFKSSTHAYQWLKSRIGKPDQLAKVNAVICSYDFLEEDNFMLLYNIREHAELEALPFIVIHNEKLANSKLLLRMGVDDCYSSPVDTDALEQRIAFLRKFKKQLIKNRPAFKEEYFEPQIPLPKRIFDIIFASLVILAISPLLLLIALAVKLESRGPIIYRSKRVGTGYQVFDFLKFRSMYPDADERLKEMLAQNQYQEENGSLFVKFKNDPRVTRVGRFIRKTSLDELPQLFNVLLGDMSIVGNRPLPLYEAETLTRDEWARRFLAPGGHDGSLANLEARQRRYVC